VLPTPFLIWKQAISEKVIIGTKFKNFPYHFVLLARIHVIFKETIFHAKPL